MWSEIVPLKWFGSDQFERTDIQRRGELTRRVAVGPATDPRGSQVQSQFTANRLSLNPERLVSRRRLHRRPANSTANTQTNSGRNRFDGMDCLLDLLTCLQGGYSYVNDSLAVRGNNVRLHSAIDRTDINRYTPVDVVQREQRLDDMRQFQDRAGAAARIETRVRRFAKDCYRKPANTLALRL